MVARKQSAFGGYMSTGVKAHAAGSCGCKAGWFGVAIQAVDCPHFLRGSSRRAGKIDATSRGKRENIKLEYI